MIFDGLSSEYKSMHLEEKEKILKELVENKMPLKILAFKMYDACEEANKDIKFSHIVWGLADLL